MLVDTSNYASMLVYCHNTPSDDLRKTVFKMIVDVSQVVKGDDLILKYGNRLCLKLRKDGDQQHHISNKLCECVRYRKTLILLLKR